ncbi:hypothetical protein DSO57_1020280 [Entomophthora muscae]|uniref:Uncharacterized protein n=1 Tax=Entomophthora muscae TaxID=34485 RepID=A0ACC2S5X6_9FUNG|nr:hypothetical protein DSO57_1020280 [Entomophthora muscae]
MPLNVEIGSLAAEIYFFEDQQLCARRQRVWKAFGLQKHLILNPYSANPKFNNFFQKLQEEQARNVFKFQDLGNQVAQKKKISKVQKYQKAVQKIVKKKYKMVEIKKYLEDVATALAGGFNQPNKL